MKSGLRTEISMVFSMISSELGARFKMTWLAAFPCDTVSAWVPEAKLGQDTQQS